MMEGMSDEQLRVMTKAAYGQELTREQLRAQQDMAKNLSPEQLGHIAKLQGGRRRAARVGGAWARSASAPPWPQR